MARLLIFDPEFKHVPRLRLEAVVAGGEFTPEEQAHLLRCVRCADVMVALAGAAPKTKAATAAPSDDHR